MQPQLESSGAHWLKYFNKAYDCMGMPSEASLKKGNLKKGISLALSLQKVPLLS